MSNNLEKRRRRSSRTAKLRAAMMAAVTPHDIHDIVKLQVFLALKGDPLAVREVLDRTVGRAVSVTELLEAESSGPESGHRGILEGEMRLMIESVPRVGEIAVETKADVETNADGVTGRAGRGQGRP
jgi:hypothetical protein